MAEFELKALITGVDRLSPALSKMQKKIRGFKRQAEEASQGGLALGGGLAAGLTLSLKSYADQENAATGLKVAMMDANGEVGKPRRRISSARVRTVLPVVTPRPAHLPPIWMMTTLTCCRRNFAVLWRHPVPAWRRGGMTSCLQRFVRCC